MKRTRFLTTSSTAVASVGFVRSPARAAEFEWKLACTDGKESPTAVNWVRMANAVKAETNGRMEIKVFPDNLLGSQVSQLDQVRIGSIQLVSLVHGAFGIVVPVAQISNLGFVFTKYDQAYQLMDGDLGNYIRRELAAKGMHCFDKSVMSGFRILTSYSKPIRNVDDMAGFKLRVIPSAIAVDLFKALGASPTPLDASEIYTAMQTHLIDGHENSLIGVEVYRTYEVQRYLSLSNHVWNGSWLVANGALWNALPPEVQAAVTRNVNKYAVQERRDSAAINDSLIDKLHRQGLAVNTPDVASMRARLGAYYTKWKNEFGANAWGMLEAKVGRLG